MRCRIRRAGHTGATNSDFALSRNAARRASRSVAALSRSAAMAALLCASLRSSIGSKTMSDALMSPMQDNSVA
jgi:hypothetical protein